MKDQSDDLPNLKIVMFHDAKEPEGKHQRLFTGPHSLGSKSLAKVELQETGIEIWVSAGFQNPSNYRIDQPKKIRQVCS